MATRKLQVEIVGDASSLQRAFGKSAQSADGFGSKMAKVGKIAAVGLAVGIGVAAVATVKFVKAALDAEKSQTRLDAAFKHANATAKERVAAMKAVSDISNKSGLDDEALADSLARLTTITGDASKATEGMAVAADIARAKGIELEAATSIVQKAMLGQVGALKRVGIEIPKVTEAQDALKESNKKATDEQKKAAKAADDLATRQAALAALQKKFGGDAEAYGKTASGAMDRFKVAIENVEEGLGAALLPALSKVAGGVADFLTKFNDASGASAKFKVVIDEVKSVAGQAWTALQQAFKQINWGQVWSTVATALSSGFVVVQREANKLQKAFDNIDWAAVARKIQTEMNAALDNLTVVVKQIKFDGLATSISRGLSSGLSGIDWPALIIKFLKFDLLELKVYSKLVAELTAGLIGGVAGAIAKAGGKITALTDGLGNKIVAGIVSGMSGLASAVGGKLQGVAQKVVSLAGQLYGNALGVGKALMRGIIDGIEALAGAALDKLNSWKNKAKDILTFNWGSDVGQFGGEIGRKLMGGVADGISSKGDASLAALRKTKLGLITEMNDLARQLAAADAKRAAQDLARAVTDAQARVNAAKKGTPEYVQAVRDRDRAVEDVVNAGRRKELAEHETHLGNLVKKIEAAKAKFQAAWEKIADAAITAFDKSRAKILTKAEQQLADIERFEAEKARTEALAQANRNLAAATTDEERLAAQEEVRRAQLAITVAGLTDQAKVEREQQDKINTVQKTAFEKALAALMKKFEDHKYTTKQQHALILALYAKFGVDYEAAGRFMGGSLVKGLESQLAAANALKAQMASLNPSGVIQGGTSGVFGPDRDIGLGALPFASGGIVKSPTFAMIGEAGPEAVIPLSRMGRMGGSVVNVTVNGWVGNDQQIAERIRRELYRTQNRNGTLGFT